MTHDPDTVRALLISRLTELRDREARLAARLRNRAEPLPADSSEQALALQDEEVLADLEASERAEMARLADALVRMDAGTWGVCVECGGPIEPGRLAVLPTADRCLDCASEL